MHTIKSQAKSIKPTAAGGDLFLISGTTLSSGHCNMLVTAVGENSRWGKLSAKLHKESEPTPLQDKLDKLAGIICFCIELQNLIYLVIIMIFPNDVGISLFLNT